MATYDNWFGHTRKHRQEAMLRCHAGAHLHVVAGRRVAEQHCAEPVDLDATCAGPAGEDGLVFRSKLRCRPADDVSIPFRNLADVLAAHLCEHDTFAVAVNE